MPRRSHYCFVRRWGALFREPLHFVFYVQHEEAQQTSPNLEHSNSRTSSTVNEKLTEWYHVRVSKPLHDAIFNLPLERRQALSNAIRKLLEREARQSSPAQ